jgi:hypothetical protein
MALTLIERFLGPNAVPGTFGEEAVQRARDAGLSDQEIVERATAAGLRVLSNNDIAGIQAKQQGLPDASTFLGPNAVPGTFGDDAARRAREAGYSEAQINLMAQAAGAERLTNDQIAAGDYNKQFDSSLQSYANTLSDLQQNYTPPPPTQESDTPSTESLQVELLKLQQQQELSDLNAKYEEAKSRAEAYEAQQKEDRDREAAEQLTSLRSGSTVSGSPGSGLGNLSSGTTSYQPSSQSGKLLDMAYKQMDPTDSVLDKENQVKFGGGATSNSSSGTSSSPRQTLTSGADAGSYYARRFG